jgi:hypothetical protein
MPATRCSIELPTGSTQETDEPTCCCRVARACTGVGMRYSNELCVMRPTDLGS